MNILVGVIVSAFAIVFVALLVWYVLAAAAEYAHHKADSEYNDHAGEALPYEIGVAYALWASLALAASRAPNSYDFARFSQVGDAWFGAGIIFSIALSWAVVHAGCVKLGKACPRLYTFFWLQ